MNNTPTTGSMIERSIAWTKNHRIRVGKTAKERNKRMKKLDK